MTEETYEVAESTEKKGSQTLWIILGIAAVILICCCCVVVLGAMVAGIISFSADPFRYFSPLLSLV
ncbi:MAG: hypothetical protein ACOCYU_04425 [Brevefilum sp.]